MAGKGIIRIYYKDSSYKSFYLHEDVTAKEVAELFGSDFLHVEKRVAAHFSIHVVIDGKDIRQLKPEDRPLRVQRDLFSLKISWNTDKNYFLFCLSDEAKVRLTAKMGTSPNLDRKQRKDSNELIVPGRLASQSSPDRPTRPLSRKLTLRPKLFFLNNKGKSEIKTRPPVPNTRSVSDLDIDKHSPMLDRDRRSITVAGLTGETISSKTKQEISENLRRMVMEEKMKLAASDRSSPTKQEDLRVNVESESAPHPSTTLHNQIHNTEEIPPTKVKSPSIGTRGGGSHDGSLETMHRDTVEKSKPALAPHNDMLKDLASPNTTKRENEEISSMFDSIFDWYPSKQAETPDPPPSPPHIELPSGGDSNAIVEDSFDAAFDDILGVLNKLRA